ncbi:hypothetical protein F8S13_17085 [Chloroflexia bacterium SDU3-3]|nr:hypothetical protein F8S13_17085 [Chloroflexia bacterium SDU3-3]
MADTPHNHASPPELQRTLEVWLPLAQHMNELHGWRASAAQLEQLVLITTPMLGGIRSASDAQALLYYSYARMYRGTL